MLMSKALLIIFQHSTSLLTDSGNAENFAAYAAISKTHILKTSGPSVVIVSVCLIHRIELYLNNKEVTPMATDYILFNHGVNTRETRPQPSYADPLFNLIQRYYHNPQGRALKKIALYWGDVNEDEEQDLLKTYRASAIWQKLWFLQFREQQLLQFVGDAALYISRSCGASVADALEKQAAAELQGYGSRDDRLHIVTHSMGTIILFDMLFSARWDPVDAPGHDSVAAIRSGLFGVSPNPGQGIRLGSISTMGSPIGFFSLMDVNQSMEDARDANGNIISTHDITPRLEKLLDSLFKESGKKLPWYNFLHPGDPIAYPLEKLLPKLVDGKSQYIDIQDILTHLTTLSDLVAEPFSQTLVALLHGGEAHNSYWQSDLVAQQIAQVIERAVQP